jgi:hypothetical protein
MQAWAECNPASLRLCGYKKKNWKDAVEPSVARNDASSTDAGKRN